MFFCFAQRHEVHKGFFSHLTFFVSLVPLCETRFGCGYAAIGMSLEKQDGKCKRVILFLWLVIRKSFLRTFERTVPGKNRYNRTN